jgi:tRNA threonylcarbamoyladenosine biosynthesis protein TsaB
MNVLAIDTASACAIALARDGAVTATQHRDIARGHAEALLPMIQTALDSAGIAYADIDLIAAALGPGSFTGLRTGLAAARGLALALGKPTLGISSFESVVHRLRGRKRPVLVALETKRADVYVQVFDAYGAATTEPLVLMLDDIKAAAPADAIIAGDAAVRLKGFVSGEYVDIAVTDAATIALLAAARYERSVTVEPLKPLYLAPPAVKLRADGGALRP